MPFSNRFRSCLFFAIIFFALTSLSVASSKLSVSPVNPRLLKNSPLRFTALLNGEVADGPIRWSSSNPAVATINSSGSATLLAAGTTTVTAVHGGQKASTVLTVTVAVSPIFTAQPTNTDVSAVIDSGTGMKVQLLDNLGGPLPGQNIAVSIGTNPPGTGTLSGTLTQATDATGTATFPDLKIDWLGKGYTLVASANPISGPVSGTSAAFNELRVGDPCLGPDMPACSSACADTDNDGLNDAWEIAGGVDLNGDGKITDSFHDVLLPGADPNKPDIYLKYDFMVAPTHSHQPPARAFDQMKSMFAAHGITLHVLAPAAGIPEHQVTTLDPNATSACAGTDFITMQQLRAENFGNLRPAYHYMVFAHDSTTPHDGTRVAACPNDALCDAKPAATATGGSEILGDDSIVSFGAFVDSNTQIGIELWASTMMHELGHNFGLVHGSLADPASSPEKCLVKKPNYISVMNFTYQVASIIPAAAPGGITLIACTTDADCGPPTVTSGRCSTPNTCFCTDDLGPVPLNPAGNNVCYRPDYAEDNLLNLNETTLNENVGVGGPSTLDDIVWYWNAGGTLPGPSNGSPIDWNNDGFISDLTGCIIPVPPGIGFPPPYCPDVDDNGTNSDQMDTTADWTQSSGKFIHLNFQFQCTAGFQNDAPGASPAPSGATLTPSAAVHEISFDWARQHHILHPPRLVSISVSPGCSSDPKPVAAGQLGSVRVALLGAPNFDVTQVDTSSLALHGAKAISVAIGDVNADGWPDLVATFATSDIKLHPRASVARVTGWLKNGLAFIGEDKIRVVPSLALEDASCR